MAEKENIEELNEELNKKSQETEEVLEETEEAQDEENQDNPENKLKEMEEKLKEWEDKYMRLLAEYDNYQKRTKKEKDQRYADAVIDTVAAFLPVADNLERAQAVDTQSEEAKNVLEGVNLVMKQFKDTLSKLDVSEIKAVGEEFNPNIHDAIMHIEDENMTENVIVEEFMKGYIYKNDRVVRHSMVKVAN